MIFNILCGICVIISFTLTYYAVNMWQRAETELEFYKVFKGGFTRAKSEEVVSDDNSSVYPDVMRKDIVFSPDDQTDYIIKQELKKEVKRK